MSSLCGTAELIMQIDCEGEKKVNKYCFRNCAYNDICNLNEENTALCKVADDKDAQDFKRSTIMGIPTKDLLAMQYTNKNI